MDFFGWNLRSPFYTRNSDGSHFYNQSALESDTASLSVKDVLLNPVVVACINIRADLLSRADFFIQKGEKEDRDNDLIKLINNPNFHQSKKDFLTEFEFLRVLNGWVFQKPISQKLSDVPKYIYNLNPKFVEFPDDLGSPLIYTNKDVKEYTSKEFKYNLSSYTKENKSINIKISDVIPFYDLANGISLTNSNYLTGASVLESVAMPIKNINRALSAENIIIQSNGREMFSSGGKGIQGSNFSTPLDEGDKRNIKKVINNTNLSQFGNRAIITNQQIDWQSLHIKLKELGLQEAISDDARLITQALRIPFEMYKNYKENTSFNNGENAPVNFVENVIQPIAQDLANSYNNSFGNPNEPIIASFKHLPMMQAKEAQKADVILKRAMAYEKLVTSGMPIDDINELMGLNTDKK